MGVRGKVSDRFSFLFHYFYKCVLQTLGVGFCNFNSFFLQSDQQCNGQRFFYFLKWFLGELVLYRYGFLCFCQVVSSKLFLA